MISFVSLLIWFSFAFLFISLVCLSAYSFTQRGKSLDVRYEGDMNLDDHFIRYDIFCAFALLVFIIYLLIDAFLECLSAYTLPRWGKAITVCYEGDVNLDEHFMDMIAFVSLLICFFLLFNFFP